MSYKFICQKCVVSSALLVPAEFEEIRTFDFDGLVNIKLAVHSYVDVKRYLLPNICFRKFAISIADHNSPRPFFSKERTF